MLGLGSSLPSGGAIGIIGNLTDAAAALLLNTYSGAVGAYGMRLLRNEYTGDCIQVSTAEVGGTTAEIGFDGNGDLDTTAIQVFADANAGVAYVTVWYDQSGSASSIGDFTGVGSLGENRVIYSGGAVHVASNGKPMIDLNYYNSSLQLAAAQSFDNFHISMLYGYYIGTSNGSYVLNDFSNEFVSVPTTGSANPTWRLRGSGGSNSNFGPPTGSYSVNDPVLLNIGTSGDTINTAWSTPAGIDTSDSVSSWGAAETFNLLALGNSGHGLEFMQEFVIWGEDKHTSRTGILENQNDYFEVYGGATPLLLETYSGAAAAYSLRKLDTSYAGPAIRVRRPSDNVEQDVPFTFASGELDTAGMLVFLGGQDGFVATWYDQSGNGNDAIQNTTANQPKIVSSGVVILENGKPAVEFDGATDTMKNTNFASLIGAPNFFTGAVSFDSTSNMYFIDSDSPGRSATGIISGNYSMRGLNGGAASTGQRLMSVSQLGSGAALFVDGSQVLTNGSSTLMTHTNVRIGDSALPLDGKVQELLLWGSDETANRTAIESNIGGYYSQNTPLLDTYSGAAAAYSLRLLDTSYAGSAIRVRRPSDNVEQDVGFTPFQELDTASMLTFLGGQDGFVSGWYDQSGNTNDAIQNTTANQPQIVSSGVVLLENGKPTLQFDGSNDALVSGSTYTPTTSMAQVLVVKGDSSTTDQIMGDTSDRKHGMALRIQNGDFNYFNGYGPGFNSLAVTANSNQNLHLYGRETSSTIYARLNGTESTSALSSIDTTPLEIYLGARHDGSLALDGNMQEYVLYLTSQAANKSGLESNIGSHYSQNTPLLDTYTGAAAAYSLRLLDTSYAGSAIRVRRPSDNVEQDIGFNVFKGLDTVSMLTFLGAEDGFVTVWYDQSGNANNAAQATTTDQPQIVSSGVVIVENGKPTLQNNDGYMDTGSNIDFASDYFVTAVFNTIPTAGYNMLMGSKDTLNPYLSLKTNEVRIRDSSSSSNLFSPVLSSSQQHLLTLSRVSSSLQPSVDGNTATAQTSSGTHEFDEIFGYGLGNVFFRFEGNCQEIILYPSDELSNRTAIETNINDFYTIY